jgi:hypothetical protein
VKEDINFVSSRPLVTLKVAKQSIARCSLTLLAIQAPFISKHCGICGRQYLNETRLDAVLAQNPTPDFSNEPHGSASQLQQRSSLAILLLKACSSCIYCGGKYTK